MSTGLVLCLGELQSTDEPIARRLGRQRLMLCASLAYLKQHGQPLNVDALKNIVALWATAAGRLLPGGCGRPENGR